MKYEIRFIPFFVDYDHPGVNNNFLINTYDTRAILYNDKSILENHHLASAFAILAKEDCNFINSLSKQEFKSMREVVIEMVFATGKIFLTKLETKSKMKISNRFVATLYSFIRI